MTAPVWTPTPNDPDGETVMAAPALAPAGRLIVNRERYRLDDLVRWEWWAASDNGRTARRRGYHSEAAAQSGAVRWMRRRAAR